METKNKNKERVVEYLKSKMFFSGMKELYECYKIKYITKKELEQFENVIEELVKGLNKLK